LIGLLVNIHNGLMSRVLPATLMTVVNTLSQCLQKNAIALLEASCKKGKGDEMEEEKGTEETNGADDDEEEDMDKEEEKVVNGGPPVDPHLKQFLDAGTVIDAQVCALETLANICTNDGKLKYN